MIDDDDDNDDGENNADKNLSKNVDLMISMDFQSRICTPAWFEFKLITINIFPEKTAEWIDFMLAVTIWIDFEFNSFSHLRFQNSFGDSNKHWGELCLQIAQYTE